MSPSAIIAMLPDDARDKGRLAALCGGLLLSFDPVFIRLSGVGGYDAAFLFGLFTALSMALMIQATDKRGLAGALRAGGLPMIVSGLLILGSASCFVLSIKHTAVANTMIILSGRPVLTAAASWLLLREKTPRSLWLAIAGVVAGIYVVVSGSLGSGNVEGDLLAMGGVLCLGLNGTLWRRYKDVSRMAVVGLGGLFVALAMSAPANPAAIPGSAWLIMAAMGLGSAPMGRVLNAVSSRYIPAAEMATIALTSVILAPAWAFLVFAERPPAATLAGGAVVLGSILAYLLLTRRRA